jgi:hypothetical protein
MIMLMGLFSFFNHHSQYNRYYQSVEEIQSQGNSWLVGEEWDNASSNDISYEQLFAEIGGYYCFGKDVQIRMEEYEFKGVLSEENIEQLMNRMDKQKKYFLKISTENDGLQENSILEIQEVKGS